ncbi:hypothetical protein [Nannocystis pusilla]|uniref:hypothetical protein n=1 Tax=Nannocystis pusilla TaxID=889268 RepID=UPI003BF035AE
MSLLSVCACGGDDGGNSTGSDTSSSTVEGPTTGTTAAPSTGDTDAPTTSTSTSTSTSTTDASATDTTTSTTSTSEVGPTTDTTGDDTTSTTGEPERDYSSDRTKFFGDPRCDGADVLLCDSFEDGAIDLGKWQVTGTVTIDSQHAARGESAAHVHTEGNGFSYLREVVTFPAPNNTYYGRMFVWIDAVPIAPDWAHWTLVGAIGSGEPGEIRVGGQYNPFAGKNLFGVGSDGGPTGDWTRLDGDPRDNPTAVVVQDWVCLEWLHDGANNETKFWWDATEHPSLATTATSHGGDQNADYVMPQFESAWVGWWLYQGNPNPNHYDVWIDEVAIDGVRIGCIL